jgi:hypothetical protein
MSAAAGARGPAAGARRSARKSGPVVRPRSSRGRRRAVPVAQWTYSIAPPLEVTRPRRNSRSRSSMFRDRSSSARAAGLVSHPPQHPLAQPVPVVSEQLVQPGARDRPVAAAGGLAAFQLPGRVRGEDLLPPGPCGERGQRGQVPVPGRGRRVVPPVHHRGVVLGRQFGGGPVPGERGQPGEGLGVTVAGGLGLDGVEVPVDGCRDALPVGGLGERGGERHDPVSRETSHG